MDYSSQKSTEAGTSRCCEFPQQFMPTYLWTATVAEISLPLSLWVAPFPLPPLALKHVPCNACDLPAATTDLAENEFLAKPFFSQNSYFNSSMYSPVTSTADASRMAELHSHRQEGQLRPSAGINCCRTAFLWKLNTILVEFMVQKPMEHFTKYEIQIHLKSSKLLQSFELSLISEGFF